jgi:hypothetical protein
MVSNRECDGGLEDRKTWGNEEKDKRNPRLVSLKESDYQRQPTLNFTLTKREINNGPENTKVQAIVFIIKDFYSTFIQN